jgi:hypothetical protein
MATPKVITAYDVEQKKISIVQQGTTLHVTRFYVFVDDVGNELDPVSGGRLSVEIEWSDIPASIQSALTTINAWTYNAILEKEGMT